jgi:hypothetical protein
VRNIFIIWWLTCGGWAGAMSVAALPGVFVWWRLVERVGPTGSWRSAADGTGRRRPVGG